MSFDLSILGVKQNVPKVSFFEYSGLIIAPAKFGKTTLATMFPKSITLAFEIGYSGQVANVKDMTCWEDFIEFIDKLEENRDSIGDEIKIISIDTVNRAYAMCGDYTLKRLGRLATKTIKGKTTTVVYNRPQDVPHGQYYPERDKDFAEQLNRLVMLGFKPFFTTHSTVKTITPKEEEGQPAQQSYDVYTSTMEDRCAKIVLPLVDYILYGERRFVTDELGNKTSKRVITCKGDPNLTAGNRVYIEEDIIFDTEEEAIAIFQEHFGDVIQDRLIKAGIMDDISELEKKQKEEKDKEVKEYINKKKEKQENKVQEINDEKEAPNIDRKDLINQITSNFKVATAEQKKQVKDILNKVKLVDADIDVLNKILTTVFNN